MVDITNEEYKTFIMNAQIENTTKESYIKHLNMWIKVHPKISDIINCPQTYVPMLDKRKLSDSSKAAMHKAIIALLKHSGIKVSHPEIYHKWYKDYFDESNSAMKKKWEDFVQSPQTLEGAMTWQQIIDKYNIISRTSPNSLEHLTLAMYTIIPPRRQMDYWKTGIIRNEEERQLITNDKTISGYVDLTISPACLTVLSYKTKKKYDIWKKELPPPLERIIRKHIQIIRPNAKYLFERLDGDPYLSHEAFTNRNNRILKKILGNEKASVNVLRHAASTYVFYNTKMTPLEKSRYARDMGHSIETQSHYVV